MKTKIVMTAAVLAAMLALPSQARAPQQPAAGLILAQARGDATCELDGRRVPQGTTLCQAGQVTRCSARGTWERIGKAC
jgi:hypothetical protein